jgi:hypothetical protein
MKWEWIENVVIAVLLALSITVIIRKIFGKNKDCGNC